MESTPSSSGNSRQSVRSTGTAVAENVKETNGGPNIGQGNTMPQLIPLEMGEAASSSTTTSYPFSFRSGNVGVYAGSGQGSGSVPGPSVRGATDQEQQTDDSVYECNICFDTAKDAVVTMCGHLFCWPCLHQWLLTRPRVKLCPVCKGSVDKDHVIPIYGRNGQQQMDPGNKVPPRPAGQREEPAQGPFGFRNLADIQMYFYQALLNFGPLRAAAAPAAAPAAADAPGNGRRETAQYQDEQMVSKMFLYVALLCLVWLFSS